MIGLEYMMKLNDISQQEISNKLMIKRQNIDSWIRTQRNIPNKYISKLAEMLVDAPEIFNGELERLIQKELNDLDKIQLQKIKLFNDCRKLNLIPKDVKINEKQNNNKDFMNIIRRSQLSKYFKIKEHNNKIDFSTKGEIKSIRLNNLNELCIDFKERGIVDEFEIKIHRDLIQDFLDNIKAGDLIEIWGNISTSNFILEANGCSFID